MSKRRSEPPPKRRLNPWPAVLLLVLGVIAAYADVAGHDFTNLDDPTYVTQNEVVSKGLTVEGLRWAFTERGYASNWHPLTWLSHMLDVELFGMDAGSHLLVNVLLHALNAALLFLVLRTMTTRLWPAFFAAALFAWHPLRVESVAWVAERKDVLSGAFFLLMLWAYAIYARRPGFGRYVPVFLAFAAGLLSKPMLVTAPFVLVLLDIWPLGRWSRQAAARLVLEKLPLLALSIGSCVLTLVAQTGAIDLVPIALGLRLKNAVASVGAYLWQTIWPANLACFYPHPALAEIDAAAALRTPFLVSGALIVVVTGLVAWQRKKRPALFCGWLWTLGMLVPVLGLVQVGTQAHADRYTYLPSIGLAIAASYGTTRLLRRRFALRPIALGLVGFVLLGFLVLSWRQAGFWSDSVTLWQHAQAVTRRNYRAHATLGRLQIEEGQLDQARFHLEEAIRIRPGKPPDPETAVVFYNLAGLEAMQGRPKASVQRLERALELNPELAIAHAQLGQIHAQSGRLGKALEHLRRAVDLDPDDAQAARLLQQVERAVRQQRG